MYLFLGWELVGVVLIFLATRSGLPMPELEHVPSLAAPAGARPAALADPRRRRHARRLPGRRPPGAPGGRPDASPTLTAPLAARSTWQCCSPALTPAEMCERWRSLTSATSSRILPLKKYLRSLNCPRSEIADGLHDNTSSRTWASPSRRSRPREASKAPSTSATTAQGERAVPTTRSTWACWWPESHCRCSCRRFAGMERCTLDSVWIKDANLSEAIRRGCRGDVARLVHRQHRRLPRAARSTNTCT